MGSGGGWHTLEILFFLEIPQVFFFFWRKKGQTFIYLFTSHRSFSRFCNSSHPLPKFFLNKFYSSKAKSPIYIISKLLKTFASLPTLPSPLLVTSLF